MAPHDVVVITGASAGIGRATAFRFGQAGARVALLARGVERLEAARVEIEAAGGRALVIECDVADANAVDAAAERVEHELGPIDVWINSAMATVFAPLHSMSADEFRRVTEVTYLGTVHGTIAALRHMRPRGRGTIIQVGSALAYRGIPLQSAYCGAKHAIRGFTDSLRSELIHDGLDIHLTMVQLAAFNTPQFDWGRNRLPMRPQPVPPIFQPEVAAESIFWAAYHRRREVWVGWPVTKTILGATFAPALLDRMLARMGYRGQQSDEPDDPHRADNLFATVPGHQSAHGRFDAQAKTHSIQALLSRHRGAVITTLVGAVAVSAAAARHRLGRGDDGPVPPRS